MHFFLLNTIIKVPWTRAFPVSLQFSLRLGGLRLAAPNHLWSQIVHWENCAKIVDFWVKYHDLEQILTRYTPG